MVSQPFIVLRAALLVVRVPIMASNEPGLAPLSALGDDPIKGAVDVPVETDTPVAPDQFDERYETSRWEIWAYYW